MKKLLAIIFFALFSVALATPPSVNDIKIPQATNSTPAAWNDRYMTPAANSLFGFDASSHPSNITLGAGLSFVSNVLTLSGGGSYQPLNTNLTSIGGLANSAGWLYNNGSGIFSYSTPTKSTVGLGLVENTALSTWAGSTNLTTVGTLPSLTVTAGISANNVTIASAPSVGTDGANKAYVDSVATAGLAPRASVTIATTANLTLSGEQTIDGVLTSGTRILVKNQTLTQNNGIYVTSSGSWTRATDSNTAGQLKVGYLYFVSSGTTLAGSNWVIQTAPVTLGTDPVIFTQFTAPSTYTANTGVKLTGSAFQADAATMPTLNQNTTGTSAGLTGTPNISVGTIAASSLTASSMGDAIVINGATSAYNSLKIINPAYVAGNFWRISNDSQGGLTFNQNGTDKAYFGRNATDGLAVTGALSATGTMFTTGGSAPSATTQAGAFVSSGDPYLSFVNSSNTAHNRVWDWHLRGDNGALELRAVDDAYAGANVALTISRSGTTPTGLAVTGALSATGALSLNNGNGNEYLGSIYGASGDAGVLSLTGSNTITNAEARIEVFGKSNGTPNLLNLKGTTVTVASASSSNFATFNSTGLTVTGAINASPAGAITRTPISNSVGQFLGVSGVGPNLAIESEASSGQFIYRRSNAAGSALVLNDPIGYFGYRGAYTTNTYSGTQARLQAVAAENWNAAGTQLGTNFEVAVTPVGSSTLTTVGTFSGNGLAVTGISASGPVSGAGFLSYFASPPAIGGTAPAAGSFTTVSATGAITGQSTATGSSTARTFANRFNDVTNVLDYGADPSFSADSSAAIVAALAACPTSGGTLFFPSGKYKWNSGSTLLFSGFTDLTLIFDGATLYDNNTAASRPFIKFDYTCSYVKVFGMNLDGNASSRVAGAHQLIFNASHSNLVGGSQKNGSQFSFYIGADSTNITTDVTVSNWTINNAWADAWHIFNAKYIILSDCSANTLGDDGCGIISDDGVIHPSFITLSNFNVVQAGNAAGGGTNGCGIRINEATDIKIMGGSSRQSAECGITTDRFTSTTYYNDRITIKGFNSYQDAAYSGGGQLGTGFTLKWTNDANIIGNVIDSPTRTNANGISALDCNNLTVANNIIHNPGVRGFGTDDGTTSHVAATWSNWIIKGNTVDGTNSNESIYVIPNASFTISNVIIDGNDENVSGSYRSIWTDYLATSAKVVNNTRLGSRSGPANGGHGLAPTAANNN